MDVVEADAMQRLERFADARHRAQQAIRFEIFVYGAQFAGVDALRVVPADTLRDFGFDQIGRASCRERVSSPV